MQEPSVLDYVKAKLMPWKGVRIPFPAAPSSRSDSTAKSEDQLAAEILLRAEAQGEYSPPVSPEAESFASAPPSAEARAHPTSQTFTRIAWPWRSLLALSLALAAQLSFAPPRRDVSIAVFLLVMAVAWAVWAYMQGEWRPSELRPGLAKPEALKVNTATLGIGLAGAFLSFFAAGGNNLSLLTVGLLIFSLAIFIHAFWQGSFLPQDAFPRLVAFLRRPRWAIPISRWGLLTIAATVLVLFFRLYRLDGVPAEMVSDHAEKYLDVFEVLRGQPHIFFPRNGGREALQFYLVAALIRYFDAPISFMTLKISTVLIGLAALPFLYLLGKEIANRRVGLLAFTLGGIAYWTNVVSRAGMRLPFYFLFTAATLYFLVRGLRTASRNHFILTGVTLGLSFYGYSADRLLPLVVMVGVVLFLIHAQSRGQRADTLWRLSLLIIFAFIVFLPLLRYIVDDPNGYTARMFSRLGASDLPAPAWVIFINNFWNALKMFSISSGVVWAVSIPDYPALGMVLGGLFYLGLALVIARYIHHRHWLDLFLVLSIPLLMLPSILSLAFPAENPNLYRTGGAMVPVFILCALALDGIILAFERKMPSPLGARLGWILAVLIIAAASLQEYDMTFHKFATQYQRSAWNYSEVGEVVGAFARQTGTADTTWVMGFPNWLDTRLVAIEAGFPHRDYAMFVDGLGGTLTDPRPKLFIVNTSDMPGLNALQSLFPGGYLQTFPSQTEGKNFLMYFVPPRD